MTEEQAVLIAENVPTLETFWASTAVCYSDENGLSDSVKTRLSKLLPKTRIDL